MDEEDQVVSSLPIRYSNRLSLQIHQFPLLSRPLQTPPSAEASGKRISARIKPGVRRLEVHVPADTRPEVWNSEKGREYGVSQLEDDREKNQEKKGKERAGEEPRLTEVRLRSEEIPMQGAQMLGVIRDGELHLHPVSQIHQFRPTLTYLDVLSRKHKRKGVNDSDSESDDGPPPDPDEPTTPVVTPKKKEKKSTAGEAKEVHVSARKAVDDKTESLAQLSTVRREMLAAIRNEEDENWTSLSYHDVTTIEAGDTFEKLFSQNREELECKSDITTFLKDIKGL
ncbi:hypothetical protein K435DRAFT_673485 [Dendrothele bispora CBS 962.96]|uniref:DNA-directed RNA polymerase III subunit Rpc5 n=1 Tax=Dendrothele bispora (strain CBS 962.96) TaxID=1314807 RepID=A0A4S8LQR6_DENBC|nr:hypothetical protein K435DRAFT_673485 [Dendrothele bispora CBS 962.96]